MVSFKRQNLINNIFFLTVFFLYLGITLLLFHRQTVGYAGQYPSDMGAYLLEIQGLTSGYDFPYPILFWTGKFFSLFTTPEHALALAVTGWNGLSAIILKYYFDKFLKIREQAHWYFNIFSTLLVFSLLLSSMIYPLDYLGHYVEIGEDYLYRYKGVFSPNPYHNATYLTARPFSIITFFLFADILSFYEKKGKWFHPKYLIFSLFLLLTTMAKPSFTLVFVSMAGVILIFRLISSHFQGWKAFWQFGISFIPTFIDLLYQFQGVFTDKNTGLEKGIGFGLFTAWSTACENIPIAILLGMAFPFIVLLFLNHNLKKYPLFLLSWQLYLTSLAMMLCLYEKGFRMQHLNFAWGYMYGLFFTYLTSLILLARNTINHKQPSWQLIIQWCIFILHLICGIDYFRILLSGGLFL